MAKMETFGCLWNEAREPSAVSVLLVDYAVYNEGHYSLFCGLFYSLIYNCITTYFSFFFCSKYHYI